MPGSHTEMYIGFNPRSHEGSDRITDAYQGFSKQFQSTLPRRERLLSLRCWEKIREFQSTLPRRERLRQLCALVYRYLVSIHAPTKGATDGYARESRKRTFQSTLPRRERRNYIGSVAPYGYKFQSTLPRRERPLVQFTCCNVFCFNPRSHEGSDQHKQTSRTNGTLFQSTLPRRERQAYQ